MESDDASISHDGAESWRMPKRREIGTKAAWEKKPR